MNREQTLDAFREAILAALDETAMNLFPGSPNRSAGATDQDLPNLFRTIDAHTERLAARYGVTLID